MSGSSGPRGPGNRDGPDPAGRTHGDAAERRVWQRSWNWYDWANSAFYTTTLTVLFAPYLISVAGRAAGCVDADDTCRRTVSLLGLHLAAGSLPFYLTSFATILSAFILPVVGSWADRSERPVRHLAGFAWSGALFACLLFLMRGEDWQLGSFAVVVASVLGGCSLVSYYSILVEISTESERDGASARGWAFGYLGGGLLLALDLVLVLGHDAIGMGESLAVRLSLLSAGLWWAGFTVVPVVGLRHLRTQVSTSSRRPGVRAAFGQLRTTLAELPRYPVTLTFLAAYLFYNDGVQTVIAAASTYGSRQLGFGTSVLVGTILLIQFVAFGGALLFGRLAQRNGSYRPILWSMAGWIAIVLGAIAVPAHQIVPFLLLGIAIAVVLGGTQALSRSFFSLLIPRGREGEYFALYNACERGTSWIGTLLFGLVFQLTGSYRPAIAALVVFFVVGGALLLRVDPERGMRAAGNAVPDSTDPATTRS